MSLIPISQSPIPSDLKEKLSTPQTPWAVSQTLFKRIIEQPTPTHQRFKKCSLISSDPEHAFVLRYFLQNKPVGYSISNVHCIHNRAHTQAFEAELTNMESEAKHFLPRWSQEPHHEQREEVIHRWQSCVQPFSPLEISTTEGKETLFLAKVLPLWHGSTQEKCESIATSGFAYFGKHAYFDPKTPQSTPSTDIGFFGSGIYFTNSAQYAALYAKGHLLLSWVSMREPYPVIADMLFPSQPTDMKMLEGRGAYQNYNAHYIPVTSIAPDNPNCMVYYPTCEGQIADWDEIIVFQKSQTLPRFWIELAPDGPLMLPMVYDFSHGYALCQTGDLEQLRVWIQEDPNRLTKSNSQGETLLYAAVLGNQLHIMEWVHTQEPSLLKICRKDGLTLMHIAAAAGYVAVTSWLHTQNPLQLQQTNQEQETPLHLAAYNEQLDVLSLFVAEVKQTEFVLLIAEKPCPKTLDFLLKQGISPHTANRLQQTLLHLAARAGLEENVECLLNQNADINAIDFSGRTPLFLAVIQGHRSVAQCLMAHQARLDISTGSGETVFHVAALYGHTPLLKDLLQHPDSKTLIQAQDEDGKTPLHRAVWENPKPDVVHLLLEYGAKPKAKNHFGYTPLHWAAKNGHIESAKLLIDYGAKMEEVNANGDLPLDLAIRWGQDAFVHAFLYRQNIEKQLEPPSDNQEEYYTNRLLQAKKEGYIEEQIFCLARVYKLGIFSL